jgi:putative ABC transport system substrate-binding protein
VRRREFITGLGGAAAAWPLSTSAQQSTLPVIGVLHSGLPEANRHLLASFQAGLKEAGSVVGQNVLIEYRWAEGRYDRLAELVADLVDRRVAVIAALGGSVSGRAARDATSTIPIVGGDPVTTGLVASFGRPSGSVTGVSLFTVALEAKRVELLHELAPAVATIAVLVNPNHPYAESQKRSVREAGRVMGVSILVLDVGSEHDIDTAFAALVEQRVGALLVCADPLFFSQRDRLVALAMRHAIPTVYEQREFAAAGGLMSYGSSLADAYRQAGVYTGRVLKGEKPADLPVHQPTVFELVINLKSAKALGLTIPPSILIRADEVFE